jgi:hypothetical protein
MPKRARPRTRPKPRTVDRRLARLTAAWDAERARHARQLAAVRRGADRRLAAMMAEIASLRHHEARAEALARLLAERDERIVALETLLRSPTQLG